MHPLAIGLLAAVLLGVAAFCIFGFLATFEPPGFMGWRILYVLGGLVSLGGVFWIALRRPMNP